MILKIDFETKRFPCYYNALGISIIKESLKASDEEYYKKLYFYKEKSNKATKNFSYSIFIKDYTIENTEFIVNDRVTMYLSTPDLEFGLKIYNGFVKKKQYKYKEYELKKIRVDLVKEKKITKEQVIFKTLSSICVKNKEGKFLDIDDNEYLKELNYVTNMILNNYRGYGLKRELSFESLDMKKVVVKEPLRDFKKVTNREYQYVNAFKGKFELIGDIEDLNDIYKLGIGFKRGQAFGNLDVVAEEVI